MAVIKSAILDTMRKLFVGIFQKALNSAPTQWNKVATLVPSTSKENTYGWLEKFPMLRKWVGDRVLKSIREKGYTITNDKFEGTVEVERTDIEDDNMGIYNPLFEAMGQEVQEHIDREVFGLLPAGFANLCYDGQNFFDTDHPINAEVDGSGADSSVSNIVDELVTDKPAWYLLDTSRPVKPLIFQERTKPELEVITDSKQETVFMKDQYLYGARVRRAFGYGFWQQAIGCRGELNEANFNEAYKRMMSFTRDGGAKLGLQPNLLVVTPENRAAAMALIEAEKKDGGGSNPNYKAVEVLVCRWL